MNLTSAKQREREWLATKIDALADTLAEKSSEQMRLRYELHLIEDVMRTCDLRERPSWEVEEMVVSHQHTLLAEELKGLGQAIRRCQQLMAALEQERDD